jgi:hypothetical protein
MPRSPAEEKFVQISIRLTRSEYSEMREVCDETGATHSNFARIAIRRNCEAERRVQDARERAFASTPKRLGTG